MLTPSTTNLTNQQHWTPPGSSIVLFGEDLDPKVGCDTRIEPVDNTISLELSNGHTLNLGTGLQQEQHDILAPTLIANTDLFAWSAVDLPGVDPQIAVHKLSIYK